MRDHLRVTTLAMTLFALVAAGPLAADASPMHSAPALAAADQDPSRPTAWLKEIWSWLGGTFVTAGPEAATASSSSKAPASSQEPANPAPDLDLSPQAGAGMDPDG
jgi:hypothetical protein